VDTAPLVQEGRLAKRARLARYRKPYFKTYTFARTYPTSLFYARSTRTWPTTLP
jgi:hypothetical protein